MYINYSKMYGTWLFVTSVLRQLCKLDINGIHHKEAYLGLFWLKFSSSYTQSLAHSETPVSGHAFVTDFVDGPLSMSLCG